MNNRTAQRLIGHINAHEALHALLNSNELQAAGLSLNVCLGPMNDDTTIDKIVDVQIAENLKPVLTELIRGMEKTMNMTAKFCQHEQAELSEALSRYESEVAIFCPIGCPRKEP